ncbi:MAG: hypothetical protein ACOC85_05390 [Thermoplasmatota archaeon]
MPSENDDKDVLKTMSDEEIEQLKNKLQRYISIKKELEEDLD